MADLKPRWNLVKFGDMVTSAGATRKARGWTADQEGVDRYVGLEHLDSNSLAIRRWGSPQGVGENSDLRHFEPGDVILARRGIELRKVGLAEFSGVASGHALVFRAKPDIVLPQFLGFFLQSDAFMSRADRFSVGSLSRTVNLSALVKEEFALPPIEEQRRLTCAFVALESNIESLRHLCSSSESLRFSSLNQFFGARVATGLPLHRVATIHAGGTPSRSRESYWGGSFPWASGKDMKVRDLAETEDGLSEEGWSKVKTAPVGATLVVVRGMILAHTFPVARCLVPMAFNQDLRALVAGSDLLPEYLTLWAEWAGPWFLARAGESSHGTKRIEGRVLESALVPIVPKRIQERLVGGQLEILRATAEIEGRLRAARGLKQTTFDTVF